MFYPFKHVASTENEMLACQKYYTPTLTFHITTRCIFGSEFQNVVSALPTSLLMHYEEC